MNAASRQACRKTTRSRIIVFGCVALSIGIVGASLYAFERGPIFCNNGCLVGAPVSDSRTSEFIQSQLVPVDNVPFWMYATNTTYMVCSQTHCATYRQAFDGRFITDERIERVPTGGAGGIGSGNGNPGNGGVGGGNGGSGAGGGGGGGGTGSVTVGKPDQVRPPNQEN